MDEILHMAFRYYGLDWLTMLLGLTGMYLITSQNKFGYALNGLACVCGMSVAAMSGQAGFVVYNMIFIVLMLKGFLGTHRARITAKI